MSKPVKIVDIANRKIAFYGATDIEIKFSSLRDGEKLFEVVLSDMEGTKSIHHHEIMVASVREYDYETGCFYE